MKQTKEIKRRDIVKKSLSREEFASELSPFCKLAEGIYISENYDNTNNNVLGKMQIFHKKKKTNIND